MKRKEDEEFYKSLSRKELQCLSKKYSLPANRSNLEMAKTLASYFQENLNSVPLETQEAMTPVLQPGVLIKPLDGARKDSPGDQGNRNYSQSAQSNGLVPCPTHNTCNKEDLGGSTYCLQKTSNSASCRRENDFPSKSASSSSFEFYTRSEDGINLCVDLNSSPSDWIQKLKGEVNMCDYMCKDKPLSFHEVLGRFEESTKQTKDPFHSNANAGEIKDGNIELESSRSKFTQESYDVVLDHQNGGDGSLTTIAIEPSSTGAVRLDKAEEEGAKTSEPDSDRNNDFISSTAETGCLIALDTDAVNSPGKKLAGDTAVNVADFPISAALDDLNSKPSDGSFEYSTLENSCSLVNSQVVTAGCSEGGSMEMPQSEMRNDASFISSQSLPLLQTEDITARAEGGLAKSGEPHLEEPERGKHIDLGEGSECTQFDESFEKTCLWVNDVESGKEIDKRRTRAKNEHEDVSVKPPAKILRSTTARKSLLRRSIRLGSK